MDHAFMVKLEKLIYNNQLVHKFMNQIDFWLKIPCLTLDTLSINVKFQHVLYTFYIAKCNILLLIYIGSHLFLAINHQRSKTGCVINIAGLLVNLLSLVHVHAKHLIAEQSKLIKLGFPLFHSVHHNITPTRFARSMKTTTIGSNGKHTLRICQ